MKRDYTKLRELLSKETYPLAYTHKFIGKNSAQFIDGARGLEKKYAQKIQLQSERKSKEDAHIALTYLFQASEAEEIIALMEETSQLDDVLVVL